MLHLPQAGDWPQLGFDAGHSGYNPYETTIGPNNVAQLQLVWSFSTGAGNTTGNVIEAAGTVFAPSTSGTLFAIDAATGAQLWTFASGSGYASSGSAPAYDSGLLFTVCNTSGMQGLCALNASTGSLAWSYTFGGQATYAGTAPVIANGSVFFEGCATQGCSYVALNERGSILWVVSEPQASCSGNGGITPAVAYNLLYVDPTCPGVEGELLALRTKSGKPKWIQSQGIQLNAGLSVGDGIVAHVNEVPSPSTQHLIALDAKSGRSLWPSAGGGLWYQDTPAQPAITKDLVYAVHGGYVASWTRKKGKARSSSFPNDSNASSPSVANSVVYTACSGTPCGYDATSLNLLWAGAPSGTPTVGVPIVASGVVYGACQGSWVCAWALPGSSRRRH